MKKIIAAATVLLALASVETASASCAADSTLPAVKKAYAEGQAQERAGKNAEAFRSYLAAQAYICEANPVEADAARRAAALSKPMAQSWEAKGDLERAFSTYDSGGHYSDADRVMIALLRAKADETSEYDRAHTHFSYRTEPSFAANNAVRIAATGGYKADPKLVAEVAGWPAKACDRALQREAQTFSEDYLRDKVTLYQSRPEDLTDFAALQAFQAKGNALAGKWPEDRIENSQSLLQKAYSWTQRIADATVQQQFVNKVRDIAVKRAQTLVQKYFGAPDLLTAAIEYYSQNDRRQQVASVEARARQIAVDAEKRGSMMIASDYYGVAGDDAKAKSAQERAKQEAQAKMQPQMDAMQKHAEELKKQYSDPAKIEAMKKQAEEMKRNMQKQQAQSGGKSAADLEKELGM